MKVAYQIIELSGKELLQITPNSNDIKILNSRNGEQQECLCNASSTQTQQVDKQSLPTQESLTIGHSSSLNEPPTADMVAKAIHIIYGMSRRREVPTEVHLKILTTIRPGHDETQAIVVAMQCPDSILITSSPKFWPASMWINILEAGHARSKGITILSMIEWIGASEWYDAAITTFNYTRSGIHII
ncbi:hypothetical protein B0O99DRAFT_640250, partial [Bisporella sp. PMI_857]